MDLEFGGAPTRGLYCYVEQVAETLGLGPHCYMVQWERPVGAYLALSDRLRRFPDRDVALIWDEENGWAMAVEFRSGRSLSVLRYLGHDVLPRPAAVAAFTSQLLGDKWPGRSDPPALRGAEDADDLPERLAGYAVPAFG